MAIKEIGINTSTLASDIDGLKFVLAKAKMQLEEMFNQVIELDTMWDGPANAEFVRQFGIDYENGKSMCSTVASLIESMEYARDQYNICENEVHGIVSAISV